MQEVVEKIVVANERLNEVNTNMFEGLCDSDEDLACRISDLPIDMNNVNPMPIAYTMQERGKKRISPRNQEKNARR